ncbi:MAG: allophanate hydrolase subunit 1 [Gemmataceae bacterium]|nr:allophanate hydrolase subunit 1 [Gemmataceae bacterium]MCI0742661.1 allophanate hydrolase subunit 1 [Gemmataceae bacterium]
MKELVPLGDQAVLAYCENEERARRFAERVRAAGFNWTVDVVQAYASVAVYYELNSVGFQVARAALEALAVESVALQEVESREVFLIPCCYELGLDWDRLEAHAKLGRGEIIRLHSESIYTVYAIGFCPGFPYLGYLDERIAGVPRLPSPRLKVEAGSVGLTGRQTGIYTEERPGGWNIVGRTPLELVHVRDGYFPLRTGDRVQFEAITEAQFKRLKGKRLAERNVQ